MPSTGFLAKLLAASLALTAATGAPSAQAADSSRPHLDLAFCIDTTGSMQSELDVVKGKMKELVAKLAGQKPAPEIRVGLVAYRDRGDEYVTRVFPFSPDVDRVVKDIANLRAGGGGDGPEAVNQALHTALNDLSWDSKNSTTKILFLIGDAPPNRYPGDFDWRKESTQAISRGIQINTIGCGELDSYGDREGPGVFREIARLADGKFESLTYRHEIVSAGGRKEVIVTSGGSAFRVKAGAEADWKAGAVALKSRGLAEAKTAGPFTRATGGGMPFAAMPASSAAMAGSPVPYLEGAGLGLTSRRENNLDEVLLNGARDAMARSKSRATGR